MERTPRLRQVWTWLLVTGVLANAASFFLPVFSDSGWFGVRGYHAANASLEATVDAINAVTTGQSFMVAWSDLGEVWMIVAWMGNLAWPAWLLARLSPALGRKRRLTGRLIATFAALVACTGAVFDPSEWGVGYWLWAGTAALASVAAWFGPRRRFSALRALCGACGYDRAGLADEAACPECGLSSAGGS